MIPCLQAAGRSGSVDLEVGVAHRPDPRRLPSQRELFGDVASEDVHGRRARLTLSRSDDQSVPTESLEMSRVVGQMFAAGSQMKRKSSSCILRPWNVCGFFMTTLC